MEALAIETREVKISAYEATVAYISTSKKSKVMSACHVAIHGLRGFDGEADGTRNNNAQLLYVSEKRQADGEAVMLNISFRAVLPS